MSREAFGIEAAAKEAAEYANRCCYRSDGYEEGVEALVLTALRAAQADAYERAAKVCDNRLTVSGCICAIRALAKEAS